MRYKDCVEYIRSDYFRVTGRNGDGMFRMSLKGILDTGFRFLFWFRLAKCDNIDLCQFTTIGSVCLHGAHIGNNVYIGPGVCIVEGVTIGDGATIGAGTVVVKDVEAGTTVAGNPAKVISRKEPGRLVYNKWEIR